MNKKGKRLLNGLVFIAPSNFHKPSGEVAKFPHKINLLKKDIKYY